GGSEYTSPIEEFYRDGERYVVEYNYRCLVMSEDSVGFSTTSNYVVEGWASVSSPEFDEPIQHYVAHDLSTHSYADWLYITSKETQSYRPPGDDIIYFYGPDTLDGKVHSNDMIHLQNFGGVPVFWEIVTSCSSRFDPVDSPDWVEFHGGYQLDYHYFPFPLQADSVRANNWYNGINAPLLGVSEGAVNDSITEIVLQPDHFHVRHRSQMGEAGRRERPYFVVEDVFREGSIDQAPEYPYPPTGALFIEGELWLAGGKATTFYNYGNGDSGDPDFNAGGYGGELTIAASGDIIITQDVVVASCNPPDYTVHMDYQEVLGLISEKHILVWRNAPAVTRIHAGLGAIGSTGVEIPHSPANCADDSYPPNSKYGTISVDGINCYGVTDLKTTLTIWGCLIMRERGLIHSSYNGGVRGFGSKDYNYDRRFRRNPPPHFFVTRGHGNYYAEPMLFN
ncbi:MAG: hypothetical protein GY839_07315, partial [candidate division Zixibacteria bacterium]|nr:hypothetical protein [candidate division Zixibacteria bacterium]